MDSERPYFDQKFSEAVFFYRCMESNLHASEFVFVLSAFLSAVYTLGESRTLESRDPRYREWYKVITQTKLHVPPLSDLKTYRNKEIHNRGTDTHTWVGMNFGEDGILVEGGQQFSMTMDFSTGKPVAAYSMGGEAVPVEATTQWVWGTPPNEVDVMDTCRKGGACQRF